tara:strand:- start:2126 stop:2329 length:204 start_codon:yes stop_codon:yes gene_type:complete
MSKYIVKNETVLQEFIDTFFKKIARKKGNKVVDALKRDPEIQKLSDEADEIRSKLIKRLKSQGIKAG